MMGGFHGFGGMGWIGMIFGLVVTIAILVGLVLLIVWAVKRVGRSQVAAVTPAAGGQSARDIVQARYARGEINREEYQQILSDLSK